MSALEFKNKGNQALQQGDTNKAIELYSKGLEIEPENPELLSNRSAAFVKLEKYADALNDAEKLLKLRPNWGKTYLRKGMALHGLGRLEEAKAAYSKGLELDPENKQLKNNFSSVDAALKRKQGIYTRSTLIVDTCVRRRHVWKKWIGKYLF